MFEKLSPEYQVNKRVRSFLLHSATQLGIEPENAKLVFKSSGDTVDAHLYNGGRHIKVIAIHSIFEFFGQDYKPSYAAAVNNYLHKLASAEDISLTRLLLVICELKSTIGAHLYNGSKYHKKISVVEVITHFLKHQDEKQDER